MDVRTIAAASLLLGLAAAASAGDVPGRAYSQAADLAAGRSTPGAVYDGSSAEAVVGREVDGALATGGLTVATPTPVPARTVLAPRPVPAPTTDAPKGAFFSSASLKFGAGSAALGAVAGWFLGGPIGALIGAVAGFAIGFLASKLLG